MGDHVPHKHTGDESVHLEPEVVIEDRLREQNRAAAVVPPLKVLLVQIALVGQRECSLLPIPDYADDSRPSVPVIGLGPTDTHVSDARQHGPNLPDRGHDDGSPASAGDRPGSALYDRRSRHRHPRHRPSLPDGTRLAGAGAALGSRALTAIVRSGAYRPEQAAIQLSRAVSSALPNGSWASVIAPAEAGEFAGEGDHSDRAALTAPSVEPLPDVVRAWEP